MANRPCLDCHTPTPGTRCPACAREMERRRGTKQQRGYGAAHERTRARLVAQWERTLRRGGTVLCPRCGEPLLAGQDVHADHHGTTLRQDPTAGADCLSHAWCNTGDRSYLHQEDDET